VDVGTKRDALVHIKDISNSYFVTNLDSKFVPGQDIDVYVKFILLSEKKLGLQMYPPSATQMEQLASQPVHKATRDVSITSLKPGMEVKGKVIRTSDFGVYVDIGAVDVTPFLHRRKIKSNRRQRKYQAGELVPLGSEVACYVHEVDVPRNRVGLTTYPPEQWAERLLPPASEHRYH
jgi:transcriptional accessory protein Tex/SPT6